MSARTLLDRIVGSLAATGVVRPAGRRRTDRLAGLLRTLISESTGDGGVERNHEEYMKRHRVACSGAAERLANGAREMVEKARGAPISVP